MSTIVVGFDGSRAAERALERAAALTDSGGRVVVVSASVSVASAGVVDEPIVESPTPPERDALLERAAETLGARGIEPALIAADTDPAQALIETARAQDADLIVVGSIGSGYVRRALVGSTAENVVRQAPCDVLIVR